MNTQQEGIILLIKSALLNEKYSLPEDFDLENAAIIAKKHQIMALIYYGALNCGFDSELPVMQKLFMDTCSLIAISGSQMHLINKVFENFEAEKIEYMPLKGTLLKKLYPKSEMRIMGDADILIRTEQYDKIKPIMLNLGFNEVLESDHELTWSKSGVQIELHKRLIPSYNKDYYKYFGDGWQLGKKTSLDSVRYSMSAEDEMIYLFTHYAKHYRDAGIGIKHIVDLWVYKTSVESLDENYIKTELKKLSLYEFYKNTFKTLEVWFGDATPDDVTELITKVIFDSGVFGTKDVRIVSSAVKELDGKENAKKARFTRLLNLVFLPYKKMCKKYKFLKKVPILLPVMWIVRLVSAVFFKKQTLKERKEYMDKMSVEKIDSYHKALNFVGLDFNFEDA